MDSIQKHVLFPSQPRQVGLRKPKIQRNGYFIEIGAYDGIQTSNTYFMEKELGWTGICIEANPLVFQQLVNNRRSINLNVAVSNYAGTCHFQGDSIVAEGAGFEVPCYPLNQLLEACQAPAVIDYLSIDIEGHEFTVLEAFDFSRWTILMMTVEHNLYCNGPYNKDRLFELLSSRGFVRMVEHAPCLDPNPLYYNQPYEDWYVHASLVKPS